MMDPIPESAEEVKEVKEVKEEVNVILVTHSARIRCFMDTFFKNTQTEQPLADSNNLPREKIRFMNSSILLLRLTPSDDGKINASISLEYTGNQEDDKNRSYFISNEYKDLSDKKNKHYIKFTSIYTNKEVVLPQDTSGGYNILTTEPAQIKCPYNIYIIRHGSSTHNLNFFNKNRSHLKYDTLLTETGVLDTHHIASYFFDKYKNNLKIHYLFASHLKRPRQTLEKILSNLDFLSKSYNTNLDTIIINKKIIILPCSHELYYKKNSNCDDFSSYLPTPPENRNNCVDKIKDCEKNLQNYFAAKEYYTACMLTANSFINIRDTLEENCNTSWDNRSKNLADYLEPIKYCCHIKISDKIIYPIDWSLYELFKKKYHCRNTNMIQILIYYIQQPNATELPFIIAQSGKITKLLTRLKLLFRKKGGEPYYKKYLKYKYKYLYTKNKFLQ